MSNGYTTKSTKHTKTTARLRRNQKRTCARRRACRPAASNETNAIVARNTIISAQCHQQAVAFFVCFDSFVNIEASRAFVVQVLASDKSNWLAVVQKRSLKR